jgi:hypothetical protein
MANKAKSFTTGSTPAHTAAQLNDVKALKKALKHKTDLANAKDENGWYAFYSDGQVYPTPLLISHRLLWLSLGLHFMRVLGLDI